MFSVKTEATFFVFLHQFAWKSVTGGGGQFGSYPKKGGSPAASVVILERCCRLQIFQKKQLQNVQPAAA